VDPVLVGLWRKEILEQARTLFEGKRGPKPKGTHESEDRPVWRDRAAENGTGLAQKSAGYERGREDGVD
jgi:hypothetical protein